MGRMHNPHHPGAVLQEWLGTANSARRRRRVPCSIMA